MQNSGHENTGLQNSENAREQVGGREVDNTTSTNPFFCMNSQEQIDDYI